MDHDSRGLEEQAHSNVDFDIYIYMCEGRMRREGIKRPKS